MPQNGPQQGPGQHAPGTSRREFLVAGGGALAALSVFGLAACGSSDSAAGGSGEVVLSVTGNVGKTMRDQVKRFNAANPDGPKLRLRLMPQDTDQYFSQVRTQFEGGENGLSVIAGDVIWPSQLAAPGYISDLTSRFDDAMQGQFIPGTVEAMRWQDKLWGVPWYTDAGLLYYRSDLLEKAGFSDPPKTWDELKEMAAKVMKDAHVKAGFVFTGAIYEGGTQLGTEFIRNAGGDVLKGDKVVIGEPAAIKGLQMQQSLVKEGIAPKAVANYKEDEAAGAFMRGDAVFMRQWPYAYGWVGDPSQSKLKKGQVGLAEVPVVTPGVTPVNLGGGWNFYINANTDQDAAWKVVQFLTAPAQQKQLALEQSLIPTRKEVLDDKTVTDKLPAVALAKQAILHTTTPPVSPYYADMSAAMAKQFNASILGQTTPERVAEDLQGELESIVKRGG